MQTYLKKLKIQNHNYISKTWTKNKSENRK